MGYTHYFQQKQKPTEAGWKAFKSQIMIAFEKFRITDEDILICDGMGETVITDPQNLFKDDMAVENGLESPDNNDSSVVPFEEKREFLHFNGHDEDSHETFYLPSFQDSEFNFCKTNRKPYDLFVMISLILAHHYMPNSYDLGTDGEEDDWQEAFDWIRDNLQSDESLIEVNSVKQLKG